MILLVLEAAAGFGQAASATLKVGDPAPKLQVSKWVQGEPVKEFARDKVYIVEFWATWCGPCRVSIPHLNELHTKFKDKGLVVIGQNAWERDQELVAPFIKKMGSEMTYRVGLDTVEGEQGKMAQTWMEAAGQNGIPAAFVVDKRGIIAWIGHPMHLKEDLLQQVLDGKFDLAQAAADYEARQKADVKQRTLSEEFRRQKQQGEWDAAEATLAEIEKLLPEAERDDLGVTRFELLLDRKDYQGAYKLAARLSNAHPENAMMQNQIAWEIATREGLPNRDLELAEKIARRANNATKASDAEILDTLARVLFLKGDKHAAIDLQGQAVKFAGEDRKRHFQRTLDDYKQGKVPNEAGISRLRGEINSSIKNKEWNKAESTLAELQKLLPPDADEDEAMFHNELAWQIAIQDGSEERGLDLAEKIIRRANAATQGLNAEILDTLARVLFLKQQKETAIELQEKAVSLAKGRRKAQFQETLDSYKQGKLAKIY